MWVFTQDGFVSAVDNNEVPGKLTVRARDRASLQNLADLCETEICVSDWYRDYQYRTHVTKEQFGDWLMLNAQTLDYDNFKDRVHSTRGDEWYHALGAVWVAMHDIIDDEAVELYHAERAKRAKRAKSTSRK